MKTTNFLTKHLPDETFTENLGKSLGDSLLSIQGEVSQKGFNIRLDGDLGAGKTALTRALLRGLEYGGRVRSPTFTLVEIYPFPNFQINHFDFYRFESPEEFDEAGFRDYFGPGKVCITEWTEKASPFVPDPDLIIKITIERDGRKAEFYPLTNDADRFLKGLE